MRHIRSILRLFLVAVTTISLYLLYLAVLLICKILRLRHEPLRNRFLTLWAIITAVVLNMNIEITGQPPEAPFYLVSNHLSYVDIIAMYYSLNCTFIAKMDVASWPLIGMIAKSMGVIFIDRKKKTDVRRVNELIYKSLNRYQGIVMFPEGGTSSGSEVLPFRASLLKHPADSATPVHFASITYETKKDDPPASDSVCWWDRSFPEHVYQLAGNRGIRCILKFGDHAIKERDRKVLADKLHAGVCQQFTPVNDSVNTP